MEILFCDTVLSVRLIYYLKTAINILKFLIPILLLIKVIIDFYKGIINNNDEQKEITKKTSSRIIAAILIFLIPTFISLLFTFMGQDKPYQDDFLTCYTRANEYLIEELIKIEDENLSKNEEAKAKDAAIKYANYEAEYKSKQEKQTTTSSYSSTLTDMKKQNSVYIKNGTFYIPQGPISGKNCKTDKNFDYTRIGYNNPYGYNNYFWEMLSALVDASKKAGYYLKPNDQGCRSFKSQQSLKVTRGSYAATPGYSLHGWGIASDLSFYKDLTHPCSGNSCPGLKWAHEHAEEFGLRFIKSENWHIQPIHYLYYKL